VPLRRPKFIFDVHIPAYVQKGKIGRADWESVLKYMSSGARYAISSITLYELVAGIDGGDDAHFPENRDRLKILYEPAHRELLPLASDFVRRTVFGLPIRVTTFNSDKLKKWIQVILHARTKADLRDGRVVVRGQSYGTDLASRADEIRKGKRQDAERLEKLRSGDLHASTSDTWAGAVLTRMGVSTTHQNKSRLLSAMDAAWGYELARYELARTQAYDFADHDSDWLDGQLLYYLSDPLMHLVTCDTKIKHRAKDSTQSSRILHFEDLLAMARALSP
jgi:hypothetical protein